MSKIKQSVKKTGKARKEVIVGRLVEKMDTSNGLVFADYKGITHIQLENLKKELKTVDSTIVIAKNSLLKLSLGKSKNFADFKDNEGLELPTATLFIKGDMVEPLKKLQKAVKDSGLPKIKFAILEGQLVDESGVLKIAALPSRDALIAQFVGMLNSPIQGFVSGLNAIPQKFVMTLDAIARLPRPEPSDGGQAKSKPAGAVPSSDGVNPSSAPSEQNTTETSDSSDATSTDNTEIPASDQTSEVANEPAVEASEVPTENPETPAEEKTTEEKSE